MAHGILTGIGFLCAGVIFREGASIHGLTTAASLWSTAAIGTLYGVGMYWLAVSSALATLFVLGLLRVVQHLMPRTVEIRVHVVSAGASFDAATLRRLLDDLSMRATAISRAGIRDDQLELVTRVRIARETDLDTLASALLEAPGIVTFRIEPVDQERSPGSGYA